MCAKGSTSWAGLILGRDKHNKYIKHGVTENTEVKIAINNELFFLNTTEFFIYEYVGCH